MNALTIRQPWAALIVRRIKAEEYRRFAIPLGPLAIHAGRSLPTNEDIEDVMQILRQYDVHASWQAAIEWCEQLPRGYVLGTVEVCGHEPRVTRWGTVANLLRSPVEFEKPLRACGQKGLWDWRPPAPRAREPRQTTLFGS
jgi:hypothetical protein